MPDSGAAGAEFCAVQYCWMCRWPVPADAHICTKCNSPQYSWRLAHWFHLFLPNLALYVPVWGIFVVVANYLYFATPDVSVSDPVCLRLRCVIIATNVGNASVSVGHVGYRKLNDQAPPVFERTYQGNPNPQDAGDAWWRWYPLKPNETVVLSFTSRETDSFSGPAPCRIVFSIEALGQRPLTDRVWHLFSRSWNDVWKGTFLVSTSCPME
jgi:hypothetical protein